MGGAAVHRQQALVLINQAMRPAAMLCSWRTMYVSVWAKNSTSGSNQKSASLVVLVKQCRGGHCVKDNTIPLTLIGILADGEFHSGEQLGERLGMSRAAINKHIQTLRDWGVDVFTVPGKGYSLPEPIQLLNEELIGSQIEHGKVAVLPVIDSTNQYLLDRLGELQSGDACVAEYQQAGRGRRGRKWFSPLGPTCISMYWRLEQGPPLRLA
jgi:biotin operon repressor BirA-like protein